MATTGFRPTPWRDMHLGNLLNAYANWVIAETSGGEFVLVADDLCMDVQQTWIQGYPAEVMVPRYAEDLEWLGMKPNRIEYSLSNSERHDWANEKLGNRKPQHVYGFRSPTQIIPGIIEPCQWGDRDEAGGEGWYVNDTSDFWPWYMTCCVVDDIDFGITTWVAGDDQRVHWSWCVDTYRRLGYSRPVISYHPLVRRGGDAEKISKSALRDVSIRAFRERGYEPQAIIDTVRECVYRGWQQGLSMVVIPEGILELDEIATIPYRQRAWEQYASGEWSLPPEMEDARQYIVAEAKRRLEADVSRTD